NGMVNGIFKDYLRFVSSADPNAQSIAEIREKAQASYRQLLEEEMLTSSERQKVKKRVKKASRMRVRKESHGGNAVIPAAKIAPKTPQCVFNSCEKYPTTLSRYASHLRN
ncbi:hypothetical protein PMAYCL1PPCAC_13827, partial [Pristionchus mayeri]